MSAYTSQPRQRPCQKVNSRSQIRPLSGYDFTPMSIHLGYVHKLVRYPVKSMAGVETNSAVLGWHGLAGDRRYAVRRLNDNSGFPWLSASRLPELLLYQPLGLDENAAERSEERRVGKECR